MLSERRCELAQALDDQVAGLVVDAGHGRLSLLLVDRLGSLVLDLGRKRRGAVDGGAEPAADVWREEVRLEEQSESSEKRWIHGPSRITRRVAARGSDVDDKAVVRTGNPVRGIELDGAVRKENGPVRGRERLVDGEVPPRRPVAVRLTECRLANKEVCTVRECRELGGGPGVAGVRDHLAIP